MFQCVVYKIGSMLLSFFKTGMILDMNKARGRICYRYGGYKVEVPTESDLGLQFASTCLIFFFLNPIF